MAALRDAMRLGLMEPFARWKLTRDLEQSRDINIDGKASKLVSGVGNGHSLNGHGVYGNGLATRKEDRKMHRKVLRFAEQGWSVIYYTFSWCFGLVRLLI
jgi:acyl-CoA-dependent ceramide synthase